MDDWLVDWLIESLFACFLQFKIFKTSNIFNHPTPNLKIKTPFSTPLFF